MEESKLYSIAKWVLAAAVAYVAGIFALGVIKGIVGIFVGAAIGTLAWQAWPLVQFGIATIVTGGFKALARRNPIAVRHAIEVANQRELRLNREETTEIDTQTRGFERMVKEAEQKYGEGPDLETLREQLAILKATVIDRRRNEGEAQKALAAFNAVTERMEMMWKASQVGLRASKRAKMRKSDYERLVIQTSASAVQEAMDRSFAQLAADRAKAEQQRAALPPAQPRATIPVTVVDKERETAPVRRLS